MIQRKQTVFLLLIFVISMLLLFLNPDLSKGNLRTSDAKEYAYSMKCHNVTIYSDPVAEFRRNSLYFGLIIIGFLALISIFLFRNPALQLRLTAFNFLFMLLFIFYIFYYHYDMNHSMEMHTMNTEYRWTLIWPLALVILNYFAFKGIRKDIELLASADRLR